MEDRIKKLNKLALDVLTLSRNTLLVHLRFLDLALSQFEYLPSMDTTLKTDGKNFIYNPYQVLRWYKEEKEIPVRNYLHVVMHCVFRHMYMDPSLNSAYWDLACDIAVENIIIELGITAAKAKREQHQISYITRLRNREKQLTAEKIYHYLIETQPNPTDIARLRTMFCADEHDIWYKIEKKNETNSDLSSAEDANDSDLSSTEDKNNSDLSSGQDEENSDLSSGEDEENSGSSSTENEKNVQQKTFSRGVSRRTMEKEWKKISERMQLDLETFAKEQGDQAGGLIQNLLEVNREKYDYTAFLKRFAVLDEVMKINDDEFDLIFYTYGLKIYKKMPLIEPLEYKEVKRIKEFIIAIDTSGSVAGDKVQKFVQKTYNILKSTETFSTKINLHIIQCDAEIQEDIKITKQEEFDSYLKTMKIKGLGGTDFRPVFSYVDELIQKKEFSNLKGLIYFTDGFGTFPARKPNFETAFVFIDDEYKNLDVPPWAIKLVLQAEEI